MRGNEKSCFDEFIWGKFLIMFFVNFKGSWVRFFESESNIVFLFVNCIIGVNEDIVGWGIK